MVVRAWIPHAKTPHHETSILVNYGAPLWTIFGDELSGRCWIVGAMFPPSIFEELCSKIDAMIDGRRSMVDGLRSMRRSMVQDRRSMVQDRRSMVEDRRSMIDGRRSMCRPSEIDTIIIAVNGRGTHFV